MMQLGELRGGVDDVGGLVALAALGDGRKERAVGFDQQTVAGNLGGDVAEVARLWERRFPAKET